MSKKEVSPRKHPRLGIKKLAGTEPVTEAVSALQEGRSAGTFYIVGMGASAGGLEAFEQNFVNI